MDGARYGTFACVLANQLEGIVYLVSWSCWAAVSHLTQPSLPPLQKSVEALLRWANDADIASRKLEHGCAFDGNTRRTVMIVPSIPAAAYQRGKRTPLTRADFFGGVRQYIDMRRVPPSINSVEYQAIFWPNRRVVDRSQAAQTIVPHFANAYYLVSSRRLTPC
ncbi:hypothetical protein AA11826_2159 [Komagataeibacter oboediens DSM 11826]|uniref:Uncharacterized protein n=1 Tax=Komagataeibacter oboediens TaxID=65958 RepID=A0A318QC96_9PROT|nr:hypothetical protein CFR80_18475 [Komagataeibacter oboediens]GBQ05449.1 hypothetical protein AA11826_2159 [Komagataeibacter oboediens DSM 11826]